jgi:hypothetical protein
MTKHLRLVFATLFALATVPAGAVNWQGIKADAAMRAEVDTDSLERGKEGVKAWDEELYARPEQARPGDFYFRALKSWTLYRCGARTTGYLLKVYYGVDEAHIKTFTPSDLPQQNTVIPGSLEELKYEFVCNYKARAKSAAPAAPKKVSAPASAKAASARKSVAKAKAKASKARCDCDKVPAKTPAARTKSRAAPAKPIVTPAKSPAAK